MLSHTTPIDLTEYITESDIIDNVTDTRHDKALSANQGRFLKELIDNKTNIISGNIVDTNLILTKDDSSTVIIDIAQLLLDVKAMSGSYDVATQSLVITLSDDTHFSIPVASLLPVSTDASLEGNGAGIPLKVALSTDEDNTLTRGIDGKLYVPKEPLSEEAGNILTRVEDGLYVGILDEDEMISDDATKPPSQQSVKAYVDNMGRDRVFLSIDTFNPSDENAPTLTEVLDAVEGRDVIVIYNKTADESIAPTHIWHIDKTGKTTLLYTSTETISVVQNLDNPNNEEVLSTSGIVDILGNSDNSVEVVMFVPKFVQSSSSTSPIAVYWKPNDTNDLTEHITYDGSYVDLFEGVYIIQGNMINYSHNLGYWTLKLYGNPNPHYDSFYGRGEGTTSMPFYYVLKVPQGESRKLKFQVSLSATSGTKIQMHSYSKMFITRIGDE